MKSKISNAYLNYFVLTSLIIIIFGVLYFMGPGITGFVVYSETQFIGKLSGENITFNTSGHALRFINISEDANVTSATLILKGRSYQTNYTINYTPSTFSMSAGCSGTIRLAPDATYTMSVCINNGSDVSDSCKTFTSGEYTVGNNFTTNSVILTDGNYRLRVSWARIKDPSARYDHGQSDTAPKWECIHGNEGVNTFGVVQDGGSCSPSSNWQVCSVAGDWFSDNDAGGCTGTQYTYTQVWLPRASSCRNYEGNSIGGSAATVGGCSTLTSFKQGANCYTSCYGGGQNYFAKTCTSGTAPTCPSNLCTYAGSNTEYTVMLD